MKTGLAKGALLANFGIGTLVLVGLGGLTGVAGCKTPIGCPDLGKCGGDLFKGATDLNGDKLVDMEWVVPVTPKKDDPLNPLVDNRQGGSAFACSDNLQVPPVPLSLVRQPPVQATDRPPDKVTADWCQNIVFKPDGELSQFIVWAPPIPVKVGLFRISEDFDHMQNRGRYTMQITYLQTRSLEFSETCLTSQGIRVTCPELGRHLGKFLAAEANIYNSRCYDPPDPDKGGCLCNYELSFIGGPNGRWYSDPGSSQITFFDDTFAPPSVADYCVTNDANGVPVQLELTGHDFTPLFNAKALRTLTFVRPNCNDGLKSAAEEGVDCGPACGNTCGNCMNDKWDPGEDGIDCGGVCLGQLCEAHAEGKDPNTIKNTCKNGVKDIWEEGVDCGSFCPNLCAQ